MDSLFLIFMSIWFGGIFIWSIVFYPFVIISIIIISLIFGDEVDGVLLQMELENSIA
jgi:hypothetical protein